MSEAVSGRAPAARSGKSAGQVVPRQDSKLPGRQAGDQHKLPLTSQTINEPRDSIIYGYATGWAHLHAVADRVSVLACEGRLTDTDRDRIHDHLREAFSGLDRLYGEGCDQLSDECDDDGDCCRTYSDGSPVYSSVRSAGQFPPPEAAEWPDSLENR
jgi:hypothetical protein